MQSSTKKETVISETEEPKTFIIDTVIEELINQSGDIMYTICPLLERKRFKLDT